MWRALLALFLLYPELFSDRELFSDCELFTDRELRDTRTLAQPHVMHELRLDSSAYPFSIVP